MINPITRILLAVGDSMDKTLLEHNNPDKILDLFTRQIKMFSKFCKTKIVLFNLFYIIFDLS